ncbi:MAG: META domain-containing protein [Pseudomonadota bacterium]
MAKSTPLTGMMGDWRRAGVAVTLLALAACGPDETISGFAGTERTWALVSLDGVPWSERATLTFPEAGQVAGAAPCNRFTASQSAPYPWIEIGPIAATRLACPALEAEGIYLTMLGEMAVAEVVGDVLRLTREDGSGEMVFEAVRP